MNDVVGSQDVVRLARKVGIVRLKEPDIVEYATKGLLLKGIVLLASSIGFLLKATGTKTVRRSTVSFASGWSAGTTSRSHSMCPMKGRAKQQVVNMRRDVHCHIFSKGTLHEVATTIIGDLVGAKIQWEQGASELFQYYLEAYLLRIFKNAFDILQVFKVVSLEADVLYVAYDITSNRQKLLFTHSYGGAPLWKFSGTIRRTLNRIDSEVRISKMAISLLNDVLNVILAKLIRVATLISQGVSKGVPKRRRASAEDDDRGAQREEKTARRKPRRDGPQRHRVTREHILAAFQLFVYGHRDTTALAEQIIRAERAIIDNYSSITNANLSAEGLYVKPTIISQSFMKQPKQNASVLTLSIVLSVILQDLLSAAIENTTLRGAKTITVVDVWGTNHTSKLLNAFDIPVVSVTTQVPFNDLLPKQINIAPRKRRSQKAPGKRSLISVADGEESDEGVLFEDSDDENDYEAIDDEDEESEYDP